MMTEQILFDKCGRGLNRSAVIELARGNMLASAEPDTTAREEDASLLQWATGADGCFDDSQVAAYGHEYSRG
jgi:hypothetical protein